MEDSRIRGFESTEVSDEQVIGMLFRQRRKGVPARGWMVREKTVGIRPWERSWPDPEYGSRTCVKGSSHG